MWRGLLAALLALPLAAGLAAGAQAQSTVSFAQSSYVVDEGEDATLTLQLSPARTVATEVRVTFVDLTTSPKDYDESAQTVTIPANATSATVTVGTEDDQFIEINESARAHIDSGSLPSGVTVGTQGTTDIVITDNAVPALVFTPKALTVAEGGSASYEVALSHRPHHASASITVAISGQADTDLTLDKTSLTFGHSNWNQAQTVTVSAAADTDRTDDAATLDHAASSGVSKFNGVTGSLAVTVQENLPVIGVSAATSDFTEGDASKVAFSVTASGGETGDYPVSVTFGTSGAATQGTDYTLPASVTLSADGASVAVPILVADDDTVEGEETAAITIPAGSGYRPDKDAATHTMTIADNDQSVRYRTSGTAVEGGTSAEAGTGNAVISFVHFNPRLASGETMTIPLAFSGGTLGTDFTLEVGTAGNFGSASVDATTGVVTLTGPQTDSSITVLLLPEEDTDTTDDTVTVSVGSGGTSGRGGTLVATRRGNGQVTMLDNDVSQSLTVEFTQSGFSVNEDQGPAQPVARLSEAARNDIAIPVTVTSGSAVRGADFESAASRTLTVHAGDTTGTFSIPMIDDDLTEGDETFTVSIDTASLPTGVTAKPGGNLQATVTILDNDETPTLSITAPADADEGDVPSAARLFTVGLTRAVAGAVRYEVCFSGTAKSAADTHRSQELVDYRVQRDGAGVAADCLEDLTLAAGATASGQAVGIKVLGDTFAEPDETVVATLEMKAAPDGVLLGTAVATHVIGNDDGTEATLTLAPAPGAVTSLVEGDAPAHFVIDGTGATPGAEYYVQLALGGEAKNGTDYRLEIRIDGQWHQLSRNLRRSIFSVFELPTRLRLFALADTAPEGDERAVLTLADAQGYAPGTPSEVTFVIGNGPPAVTVEAVEAAVTEGAPARFTVRLSEAQVADFDVAVRIAEDGDGDFVAGDDEGVKTFTVPAGETEAVHEVATDDDTTHEPGTAVTATVEPGAGYTVGTPASAAVAVADDGDLELSHGIDPATAGEGSTLGAARFYLRVRRALAAGETVTVPLAFTGGTLGTDFTLALDAASAQAFGSASLAAGTVTFTGPADRYQSLYVDLFAAEDDDTDDEVVTLGFGAMSTSAGGDVGLRRFGSDRITLLDNDAPQSLTVELTLDAFSAFEDDSSFEPVLRLSEAPRRDVAVAVTLTDGTAVRGADYEDAATRTVTFPAGKETTVFDVKLINDAEVEGDETFTVAIDTDSLPAGVTAKPGGHLQATVTIHDDDSTAVSFAAAASSAGEGAGAHAVTVNFTQPSAHFIYLKYTVGGTARAGEDFTIANSGAVSVPANTASVDIEVAVLDDTVPEHAETVVLTLTDSVRYALGATTVHTLTLADDDAGTPPNPVRLSVSDAGAVAEGGTVTVTATLDHANATGGALAIPLAVRAAGTTAAPGDYTVASSIAIADGATAGTTDLAATDDDAVEAPETVVLALGAALPEGVAAGTPGHVTVTIADDDLGLTYGVRDWSATEGEPTSHARLFVRPQWALGAGETLTVPLTFTGGTLGTDFTLALEAASAARFAAATLAAGTVTLTGPARADAAVYVRLFAAEDDDAGDETVTLGVGTVASSTGAAVAASRQGDGRMTLLDNDGDLELRYGVLPATAAEGSTTALRQLWLTPRRALAAGEAVTVPLVFEGGTLGTDFTLAPGVHGFGSMVLAAGTVTLTGPANRGATGFVNLFALEDDDADDEVVTLGFGAASSSTGAAVTHTRFGDGRITLLDNDAPQSLTVEFASDAFGVYEHNGPAEPVLRLSEVPRRDVAVRVTVTSGTAVRGEDFLSAATRTATFPAGGATTTNVPMTLPNDALVEGDETFTVAIDTASLPANVTAKPGGNVRATVTLFDDDTATVGFARGALAVREGDAARPVLVLSKAFAADVTVGVEDAAGTATAPGDYAAGPYSVTFPAGAKRAAFDVATVADSTAEGAETFSLRIPAAGLPAGMGLAAAGAATPPEATVTVSESAPPSVPEAAFAAGESDAGEAAGTRTVTVHLVPPPTSPLALAYTVGGTATAGADFTIAGSGIVAVPAHATGVDIEVAVLDDTAQESDETLVLTLAAGAGYTVGAPGVHTLTLADDDAPPPAPVVSVAGTPGAEGGAPARFLLTVRPRPAGSIAVNVRVTGSGGYAGPGETGTRTVTMDASGSAVLDVAIADDAIDEPNGSFTATVRPGTGYAVHASAAAATVAVADDDPTRVTLAGSADAIPETGGTKTLTVRLARALVAPETLAVPLVFAGEAVRGLDYTLSCGNDTGAACRDLAGAAPRIEFSAGGRTATVTLAAAGDAINEGAGETVTVALGALDASSGTGLGGGAAGAGSVAFTITDDDAGPEPGIVLPDTDVAVVEGATASYELKLASDPGDGATVRVSVTSADTGAVTVSDTQSGVNGTQDWLDFTGGAAGTWSTAQTVTVAGVHDADSAHEADVALTHTASVQAGTSAPYAGLASRTLHVDVTEDDAAEVGFKQDAHAVDEGDDATLTLTFTRALGSDVTVRVLLTGLGATGSGVDFDSTPRSIAVPAGTVEQAFTVSTVEDEKFEGYETFQATILALGLPDDLALAAAHRSTVTIVDDEASVSPALDAGIHEGETLTYTVSGIDPAHASVTLLAATSSTATRDVDGTWDAGEDYRLLRPGDPEDTVLGATDTLTPSGGAVTFRIKTRADTDDTEGDETVVFEMELPGVLGEAELGTLALKNGPRLEAGVALSAQTLALDEGTTGTYTVALTLAPAPGETVTVTAASRDAGAVRVHGAGGSPGARATLTFTDATWSAAQTVTVTALSDLDASDESVDIAHAVKGTGDYADVTAPSVAVTVDDDEVPVVVSVAAGAAVDEGGAATFTVTATPAPPRTLRIALALGETGAFLAPGATLPAVHLSPTRASQSVSLATEDDTVNEAHGAVTLTVEAGTGYVVAAAPDHTASVEVRDDDGAGMPVVSIASAQSPGATAFEGDALVFTVRADPAPAAELAVTVGVAESAGSAFVVPGGTGNKTVTIAANARTATLSVATVQDTDEEDPAFATVTATVAHAPGYTVADAPRDSAQATVSDDDGLPGVTIHDAQAEEGDPMFFRVTLSKAAAHTVEVKWATRFEYDANKWETGSARYTLDYTSANGILRFAPRETVREILIYTVDDAHDEGDETFEVELSDPVGAVIADGLATGTITNDDPLPAAWLARFGRTVAEQALEGVADRIAAPRKPGMQGTLAGQALSPSTGSGQALDPAASGQAAGGTPGTAALALADVARRFGDGPFDPFGHGAAPGPGAAQAQSRTMTASEALLGSSFTLTGETDGAGGTMAFWGRAAQSSFDGVERGAGTDIALDGTVTTGMLGADYARGPWLVGLALTLSSSEGSYAATGDRDPCPGTDADRCDGAVRAGDGTLEASLTAAVPYASWRASERLKLWGALGYGAGEVTLKTGMGERLGADIDWTMAAAGLRGDVIALPMEGSGLALAVTSDAMWARTASEKTRDLAASESDVTRLRLGLEGSYRVALEEGGSITPKLEVGARHDGGDAETGFGVELGGGIAWVDPKLGLSLDLSGRTLIAHGNDDLEDRGYSASLAYDPAPATKRGPSLTLTQDWGGGAEGGLDALFAPDPLEDRTADGEPTSRWAMEAAYGLPAFGGRWTGSPHAGLGLATGTRDYTIGWRLTPEAANAPDLSLGLKATRRESDTAEPEHSVGVEVRARW